MDWSLTEIQSYVVEALSNALFKVLKPGITWYNFEYVQNQLYRL